MQRKHFFILLFLIIIMLLITNVFTIYKLLNTESKKIVSTHKNNNCEVSYDLSDNFVFLGDSLTARYPFSDLYDDALPIVNSGIGGNKTTDILNNMYDRVYKYNPTKVFLQVGTNDLYEKISNEEIANNIIKISDLINKNKPNAKVFIESMYPVSKHNERKIDSDTVGPRSNDNIKKINTILSNYCKKGKCTYIDVYSGLVDDTDNLKTEYTEEGLHLSNLGYLKLTSILSKYLH